MKTIVLLFAFTAAAHAAEVVANFTFDNGSQSWTPNSTTQSATLDFAAAGSTPGSHAVRITTRGGYGDGVRQEIRAALPASPGAAGEPYRITARVNVDQIAFVRVMLQFEYFNAGSGNTKKDIPIILAEKVILTPGQWIDVEGVKNIVWPSWAPTPPANRAQLYVETGQVFRGGSPTATPFPSYALDFLSVDRDTDLDGLSDTEEQQLLPPSNPALADTDGDGLPDKWEKDNGLAWAPAGTSNDASGDGDGDGFTNWQEYQAATDPRPGSGAQSFPGKTANPNATPAAKAMARYLALLPSRSDAHVLVGQMLSDPVNEFAPYAQGLADAVQQATGTPRWPAMLSLAVEGPTLAMDLPAAAPFGRSYAGAGGFVMIKWAMWNPWTGGFTGDQNQVDIPGLIDPASPTYGVAANVAARAVLDGWLDTVATELARFLDPAFGGHPDNVVLFRPLSEMNGGWFWWGHRSREEYLGLWNYIWDRLVVARGLNHLLFVYESDQSTHYWTTLSSGATPSDYYYPGDDRVDAMTHNFYDGDWVLPHDFDRLYRSYPKIYGFPQAGPDKATRTGTFNNLIYADRIQAAFPRASFFIVWNSFNSWDPVLMQSVHQHIAIVDNQNAVALMTDPRMVVRETLAWKTPWQSWAQTHLGTLGAPAAGDPDADGRANVVEYAVGGDPLAGDVQFDPVVALDAGGWLTLTMQKNPAATDVQLFGESTEDLSDALSWSSATTTVLANTPTLFQVRDNTPYGAAARAFLRVRVVMP